MRTIEIQVYKFDELSDKAQQKVLHDMCDINVRYDWWDWTFEDTREQLKEKGQLELIQVNDWDLYRGSISLEVRWLVELEEDEMEDIEYYLKQDILSRLRREYDYQISYKAIKEAIEANDYEFYENGILFG